MNPPPALAGSLPTVVPQIVIDDDDNNEHPEAPEAKQPRTGAVPGEFFHAEQMMGMEDVFKEQQQQQHQPSSSSGSILAQMPPLCMETPLSPPGGDNYGDSHPRTTVSCRADLAAFAYPPPPPSAAPAPPPRGQATSTLAPAPQPKRSGTVPGASVGSFQGVGLTSSRPSASSGNIGYGPHTFTPDRRPGVQHYDPTAGLRGGEGPSAASSDPWAAYQQPHQQQEPPTTMVPPPGVWTLPSPPARPMMAPVAQQSQGYSGVPGMPTPMPHSGAPPGLGDVMTALSTLNVNISSLTMMTNAHGERLQIIENNTQHGAVAGTTRLTQAVVERRDQEEASTVMLVYGWTDNNTGTAAADRYKTIDEWLRSKKYTLAEIPHLVPSHHCSIMNNKGELTGTYQLVFTNSGVRKHVQKMFFSDPPVAGLKTRAQSTAKERIIADLLWDFIRANRVSPTDRTLKIDYKNHCVKNFASGANVAYYDEETHSVKPFEGMN